MISILYKLLILIDDQGKIKKPDIAQFLPEDKISVIYSALARLKKKKLVNTSPNGRNKNYQITAAGKDYLYQNLNWLKTIGQKQKWFLVLFSIPEKRKPVREQFRRSLQAIGMMLLQRGVCLGQLSDTAPLEKLIAQFQLQQNIKIFEVINPQLPSHLAYRQAGTPFDQSLAVYQKFIQNSQGFLKYISRFDQVHRRFRAKTLVFLLSQAIKIDPQTSQLEPTRKKSLNLYQKIREYCY